LLALNLPEIFKQSECVLFVTRDGHVLGYSAVLRVPPHPLSITASKSTHTGAREFSPFICDALFANNLL